MSETRAACEGCLRRAELIGHLAPRIAGLLCDRVPVPGGLLELPEGELVEAVAGSEAQAPLRWLEAFEPGHAWLELERAGLDCVCRHSDAYPPALLDLRDPPAALYVAGERGRLVELLEQPAVTVVGGRRATPYGLEVARGLGRGLAAAGITVVSGLALGVDGTAHRGALEGSGRTLAVLASGADVPYPRSHRALYARVRERGVVISEMPPGTPALRWGFPARNRIMAALGSLTIVVEAEEGSGSLITAACAADIGREVGAVPGRVTLRRADGSNRLLRDGAQVIRGAEDVLDELFGVGRGSGGGPRAGASPPAGGSAAEREGVARLESPLGRVLEAVEAGHGTEAIGREVGLSPGDVRSALGRLELLGLVRRDGLGLYERAYRG
jgi:DNA processing protein